MPSSRARCARRLVVLALAWFAHGSSARAQRSAPGFALERLYRSAAGGGWFVMDSLDLHGGLGGAIAVTGGYARNPLRVSDSGGTLDVVSAQAFAAVALAVTYDRLRLSLDFDAPIFSHGDSGLSGGYVFTAPSVDLSSHPDTLSDLRAGVDVRIAGEPHGRFRFGAGAQFFIPFGDRAEYDTDGWVRGMVRALVAGDLGLFTYAAQLGVHLRTLDDTPAPGSPRGSELLLGLAVGARIPVGPGGRLAVVVGPEIFGSTAFRTLFGAAGTELEGLLSARLEGTDERAMQSRVKLGAGFGINQAFGAPDWRVVAGVELFARGLRP